MFKCVTSKLKTKQEYNLRCVHISVLVYIKFTRAHTHMVVHVFTYVYIIYHYARGIFTILKICFKWKEHVY